MSPLEELRAAEHEDITLSSDHALTAYLDEIPLDVALLDLAPRTEIEARHLARTRSAA